MSPQRVLIVDRSDENREVLKIVLQRQGIEIFEADEGDKGWHLARKCHPDVVVLDADTVENSHYADDGVFGGMCRDDDATVVLLGKLRRPAGAGPVTNVVAKPYHYGPLVRKIEGLLSQARETRQQSR